MPQAKRKTVQCKQINHPPSLSALDEAWASVAAAKKELKNVDTRIRQTTSTSLYDHTEWQPPVKSKHNPNIERRIVYQAPEERWRCRKENVPPHSYSLPAGNATEGLYADFAPPHFDEVPSVYVTRRAVYNTMEPPRDKLTYSYDTEKGINCSLTGRSLLTKESKSVALSRLKGKIQQQKINASSSFHKQDEETQLPEKPLHFESDPVVLNEPSSMAAITRKVTSAPIAPSYKGFNEPISRPTHDEHQPKEKKRQSSCVTNKKAKKKEKPLRIIAPKKPVSGITTSSWRLGQEIQRKVREQYKEMHVKERTKVVLSPVADSYEVSMEKNLTNDVETVTPKDEKSPPVQEDDTLSSKKTSPPQSLKDCLHRDGLHEQSIDSEIDDLQSDSVPSSDVKSFQDDISKLKEHKQLSNAAKDVLNEVEKESLQSPARKKKVVCAAIDTGLKKNKAKKSPPYKRKTEDELHCKQKMRHYDQEEVQKYMHKQQQQRKKQMLDEKRRARERQINQEKKLKELYEKQKAAFKDHTFNSDVIKKKQKRLEEILLRSKDHFDCKDHPTERSKPSEPSAFTTPRQTSSPQDSLEGYMMSNSVSSTLSVDSSQPPQKDELASNILKDLEKSKAERIAAIRSTAAALRQRLDEEAKRLTSLVHGSPPKQMKSTGFIQFQPAISDVEHFSSDEIPGVHSLADQATANQNMVEMELAAQKIQSLYRGHSVRQSLSWKLPSGRSLYQSIEEARRRAFLADITNEPTVYLASSGYPPVSAPKREPEDISSYKDEGSSSVISSKMKISSNDNSFPSYTALPGGPSNSFSQDANDRLRNILAKHSSPGDKYSVINVFTRNHDNDLSFQGKEMSVRVSVPSPEAILVDDVLQSDNTSHTNLSEDVSDLEEQHLDYASDEIYVEEAETQPSIHDEELATLPTNSPSNTLTVSELQQRSLLSPKSLRISSDSEHSEKLFSPKPYKASDPSSTNNACQTLMSASSSDPFEDDHDILPVFTSTHRRINQTPPAQNVNYTRGKRMSPNTLERRLRAEINLFDDVADSLQQMHEMEQVQAVVLAQQESVALAQMLKSRQVAHQQDLDRLSIDAKHKAVISAKEVEAARLATAEASNRAIEAIADVKMKSAKDAQLHAEKLIEVQEKMTSTALETANRMEEARKEAAAAYKFTVDRQIVDVEKIAVAAASAASATAVETALQHHKDQLEQLRKEALSRVSSLYTPVASGGSSYATSATKMRSVTPTSERSSLNFSTSGGTKLQVISNEELSATKFPEEIASSYSDEFHSNQHEESSITDKTLTQDNLTQRQSNSPVKSVQSEQSREKEATEESQTLSTVNSVASELSSSHSAEKHSSKMSSIAEELNEKNKELSEASFSTVNKEKSAQDSLVEETSIHSDERFHSSLTEDELKHDFRMVLPSENHRLSLDWKELASANDTSSDELATPSNVAKWSRKRPKSPFAREDTFTRFTVAMVKQYIQEEEMRAKHQTALLALREKAIIEKTKAEVAFLEKQKKGMKKKGADEKMPPITKKQRGLLMKLKAEQTEIRRQKESIKAASVERQSMMNQQEEIQRIRASTKVIWNKVGHFEDSSTIKSDRESAAQSPTSLIGSVTKEPSSKSISEAVPSSQPSVHRSSTPRTQATTPPDDVATTHAGDVSPFELAGQSSVSQDIKRLRSITSKRYLTEREKKLQSRKQQFNEILQRENKLKDWRQKIIEEEQRLKADIKRVLGTTKLIDQDDTVHSDAFDESKLSSTRKSSSVVGQASDKSLSASIISRHDGVIVDDRDVTSSKSTSAISEEVSSSKESTVEEEIVKTSKDVSVAESISDAHISTRKLSGNYSNETFEECSPTQVEKSRKSKMTDEDSFTEGTSDASDIEQRLKGLENELQRRRNKLHQLRRKKEKATLRLREQELTKELQYIEQQIHRETTETSPCPARTQTPRVLSPRNSLESIILSDKLKFSSDKESRRSLDFSDKDTDSKSSDVKTKSESLSDRSTKSNETTPKILTSRQSKVSYDVQSEVITASDVSECKTKSLGDDEVQSSKSSEISEEMSKDAASLYDDDFFESNESSSERSLKQSNDSFVVQERESTSDNLSVRTSDLSSIDGFCLEDVVSVEGLCRGVVKYLGRVTSSTVPMLGIQLIEPLGNNDGRLEEKQYFQCEDGYGLFTTVDRITKHISIVEDIEEVLSQHTLTPGEDSPVTSSRKSADDSTTKSKVSQDSLASVGVDDVNSVERDVKSPPVAEVFSANEQLDLALLTDNLTNSLLKDLLKECLTIPVHDVTSSEDRAEPVANHVTNALLLETMSHMMSVKNQKEKSLLLDDVKLHFNETLERPASQKFDGMETNLLSDQLKSVHDELGALLGDDDDDDVLGESDVLLPAKDAMHVPFDSKTTEECVWSAMKEMEGLDHEEVMRLEPSQEYLEEGDSKGTSHLLYKRLVYDVTKNMYAEVLEFRAEQKRSLPQWKKVSRKTYTKFTHTAHHMKDLRDAISSHVCTCLNLREGRPSLDVFKRKLPLNLSKKDYVDAMLVDELRQEEVQWVDYTEDELRVKYQLADDILENLLMEITDSLPTLL